jgi:hypothetical protein
MIKLTLLGNEQIFVTMMETVFGDMIFDSTEGFIGSPRFMSLFTISLMAGC